MSDLDRTTLPIRRSSFQGVTNRTLAGSQPDWNLIGHPTPPEGAPNVLLVLIDDAGFGNPSTFGGPIQTPNYTRIAEGGVRYNRFHVTALCSPTRAALLTGRNSHTVGFGSVGEFAGGFPGYSATLPRDCAPLPRILRDNGYSTAAFGKWHLTPDDQQGPAGPFDRWPNGWGFDYFYGFLGGGASQWDPCLAENQKIIGTPAEFYDDEDPYYFPDAMADRTIEWLHGIRAQDADKPFFAYFSTGCSHAPHHVGKEWADKYKGKFDQGWDKLREETFARQKALGVIPADTELTARNDAFPAWDDVPDNLKAFYARQMEVYAGFSENADHNVGRVIDAIDELGELDNTIILWIWGDNGASMEGTITGSFNELTMQNGIPLTDEMQLQLSERYGGLDQWGAAIMDPHYSAAWAWAGNTPFQWGKQVGSHLGGTRNPMVVHWPAGITDAGGLRSQFTHVIDVAPTILELAGIPQPNTVDGIDQEPMQGASFTASLTDADAPEHRTQQYFETVGNRAMYKDGWWLAMKTERIPWVLTPDAIKPYAPGVWNPDEDPTELYYLPDDFSQANDLAAEHPEKVQELKDLFWEEAERYQVLPLLATIVHLLRHAASDPEEDDVRVPRRRAERDVRDDPAHLQPLLLDHRRPAGPRGRRRGRDRRRGRPPRRLHPLRQGRQAHPHLLDDGRVHLQAGRRGGSSDRRRRRAAWSSRPTRQPGDRRRRHAVHRRPTGRQGTHGPHRARPVLRLRRDGHRPRQRRRRRPHLRGPEAVRVHRHVKKVVFDIAPHLDEQDELDLHTAEQHGHAAHALSA